MKNKLNHIIIAGIASVLLMACASDLPGAPGSLQWYSLDEGSRIAGDSAKKILVYFRADW